jgi:hypothetical protein
MVASEMWSSGRAFLSGARRFNRLEQLMCCLKDRWLLLRYRLQIVRFSRVLDDRIDVIF